ncbi:maltose ABC transporter permease MalF [Niveibacterium sp.]|uniref:maltose ABC transporter permease MalF n=1 Tax=Niveibacterium sp. TaxID=2017444 RepID=UPI0035AF502D
MNDMPPHTRVAAPIAQPRRIDPRWRERAALWGPRALGIAAVLPGLAIVLKLYLTGQWLFGVIALSVVAAGSFVYQQARSSAWRFLFPGLLAAALFVVLPIAYTVSLSTSNYSSQNLLTFGRATDYLLSNRYMPVGAQRYGFALLPEGKRYRARLESETGQIFLSETFTLGHTDKPVAMTQIADGAVDAQADTATLVRLVGALKTLVLQLPDGSTAQMSSLHSFDTSKPLYLRRSDGTLVNQQDHSVLRANHRSGYYETASGEKVAPGFTVSVGPAQFLKLLTDEGLSKPFLKVFGWTLAYSGLTVLLSFAAGLALATVLSWQELRWRETYKLLFYLPSAVPMMIAVLIVKMMFFTNTGEVNAVLDTVFGIRPEWFHSPTLARTMVVIVSVWLHFPYMMMLCLGLIRAIPAELYEASALAGAGPLTNFTQITLPLIARPILPVLIASFASTFNNAALIVFLTDGNPSYLDTRDPVGMTDLLASATYRIAFFSGSNFGLAAAISVLLFLIVAVLAFASLRLTRNTGSLN